MRFSSTLFILTALVSFQQPAEASDLVRLEAQVQTVAAEVSAQCVAVHSKPRSSWGSGVIVSKEGHLFSAAHVVESVGERVDVYLNNGDKHQAIVRALDLETDSALLQFSNYRPTRAQVAQKADGIPAGGEACLALGHAYGFDHGRSAPIRFGLMSHESRNGNLMTTCRVAAGDSGGPLFNLRGELIGIHRTIDAAGRFTAHIPVSEFRIATTVVSR